MATRSIDDSVIQKILSNYIKHRNYQGGNSESVLNESFHTNNNSNIVRDNNVLPAKDWFFDGALSAFQSMRNVTSLRSNEEDFVKEVEVAYKKFIDFANHIRMMRLDETSSSALVKKVPRIGEELYFICFPLFVHIFIQLFECGYAANARKFFLDHYQKFIKKTNHLQFINSIQASLNNNALNPILQNFKKFKCRILITEESFHLLTQFLKQEHHLSILQILNSCLDFRVMSQDEYATQQVYQEKFNLNSMPTESNFLEVNQFNSNNSLMKELLETIKEVRNSESTNADEHSKANSQTCVCLYKILSNDISSVAVTKNISKIVAGTESSEIVLWDFDLADDLQYYSARVYKHWRRVPVKRVTSSVDFKFIDYNHISNQDDIDAPESSFQDNISKGGQPLIFRGHSKTVYEMSFVQDSNLLLSASGDTTIRAWDTNSGSCLCVYQGHAHPIWTIDSNNSGCFLSGGRDGNAFMWDIERTVPLRMYCGHFMDINQIKFHPNCNYLATASADKTIILWDVNQVRQVRMFCGHNAPINTILFSSCGKYLTSASEDGSIRLWDISQGRCISELLDHNDNIRTMAFAPKDQLLASCGAYNSTVHIWENPINSARSHQSVSVVKVDLIESTDNQDDDHNLIHVQFIKDNLLLAIAKNRI